MNNWEGYIFTFLLAFTLMLNANFAIAQESEDSSESVPSPISESASTQTVKKTKRSAKNKRTEVNFEDQLIKGEVQKPELFYLLQKKQFNFGKLIKLRENFLPEMRKTAEDVPRGVDD
jgi:hypothetical protein